MDSVILKLRSSFHVPSNVISLTTALAKRWEIKNGESIHIEIGNKETLVKVKLTTKKGNHLVLSPHIWSKLAIPFVTNTRAVYENNILRLGPVIGILTTGFAGTTKQPFGSRSQLFRNFIREGEVENPIIYVFTPEMINWHNKTVQGWYYHHNHWVSRISPLPNVVYERVPNRKVESHTPVKKCLSRLRTLVNCQIFNQGFFNKWSIHERLSDQPNTAQYIPETYLSPSIKKIDEMLKKHHMVYLKPSGGSLGLGIFRITYVPKKGYFCRFHQGTRNVLQRFQTLNNLFQHYFNGQTKRFNKYIVQQGVRLIKHFNRPVDFRIHLHKDASGDWQTIAIGSKVAGSGCVTTHVRTGGTVLTTSTLLQKVCGSRAQEIESRLKKAAVNIATTLEVQTVGLLGELGMDIGLDSQMRIWLFEVNSKPGRHIFEHPSLRQAGRQSAKCITDYSLKLANFV